MSVFKVTSRAYSSISPELVKKLFKKYENGFDNVMNMVKIISCKNGKCQAEITVKESHTNVMKGIHGGFSASLVDLVSSLALLSNQKNFMLPTVSVGMNISFLKTATIGDELVIDAETLRNGRNIAYLKCFIRNKATGNILVEGSHTKCYSHQVATLCVEDEEQNELQRNRARI